jgi:4-nitrophenyl phosphatase
MKLQAIRTLLIDGDGVLWHGERAFPGLPRFFEVVASRGIVWGLLTNNATRPVSYYVEKLARFGIKCEARSIFTSSVIAAAYLRETYPAGASIYAVGEEGLKSDIRRAGFVVHDDDNPPSKVAAVVAGLDRSVTYGKLRAATLLIRAGADFIGSNPDRTLPTPEGLIPGAGTILAALAAATDRQPLIIGKPQPTIFSGAMKALGAHASTTAMLGDRLDTDIAGAAALNLGTILVMSGVSTRADLAAASIQPEWVFESISEFAVALEAGDA